MEEALAEQSVLEGVALKPDDIANSMLFLASDMARCVNVSSARTACIAWHDGRCAMACGYGLEG